MGGTWSREGGEKLGLVSEPCVGRRARVSRTEGSMYPWVLKGERPPWMALQGHGACQLRSAQQAGTGSDVQGKLWDIV